MSALWGLPYLLIKVAVAELEPALVVWVRVVVAVLVRLPIAFKTDAFRGARHSAGRLVAVAVIGLVLPFLLIAYGETHIGSSLAALLIAADPLFIVLLALRFDPSERASGLRLLGLVLGFVGVAALVGLNPSGDAFGLVGAGMILLAACCYGASALLVKHLAHMPMLGSSTLTLTISSVLLMPLGLTSLPAQMPSIAAVLSLLGLAIPCTAIAYVVYYSLIAEAGATRASLITYVNPAVAVLLGALVLGEPITLGTVIGFVLIVAGCALSTGAIRNLLSPRRTASSLRIPTNLV